MLIRSEALHRTRASHAEQPPGNAACFYGALNVSEGPVFEGAVVLQFLSVTEARSWYDSSEYQAAALHRRQGAAYRVFIVEGSSPA